MLSLLLLAACETSKIPTDALHFSVEVAENSDDPDYTETFEYYLDFDASSAVIYIGEDAFARGTLSGCDLLYQSVVVGQDRAEGNLKWQLFGEASMESADGDPCVEGEDDWAGIEYFEIVASEDEAIPVGTQYFLNTTGAFVGLVE